MKKILIASITLAMVFSFGVMVLEVDAANETGFENSPAFEQHENYDQVWENQKNYAVSFNTDNHNRTVPGKGGENADEDSVVEEWREERPTMVKPRK